MKKILKKIPYFFVLYFFFLALMFIPYFLGLLLPGVFLWGLYIIVPVFIAIFVHKNNMEKYKKIFIILTFYIFGGFVVFISLFRAMEYIFSIIFWTYVIVIPLVVLKTKKKIFYVIPVFLLLLQLLFSWGNIFPSEKCQYYLKGLGYDCDCSGLHQSAFLASRCIGERTACYIFESGDVGLSGARAEKEKVNCDLIDRLPY